MAAASFSRAKIESVSRKYWRSLHLVRPKTRRQIVIAFVGLVGSGKSWMSKKLAPIVGATVIRNDDIRVRFGKPAPDYRTIRRIAFRACERALKRGANVIFDSDFVDPQKRRRLRRIADKFSAKLYYIRLLASRETVIRRFKKKRYSFFDWHRDNTESISEMIRRTPLHYDWSPVFGGRYRPKKLKVKFFACLDVDSPNYKKSLRLLKRRLKAL